MRRVGRRAIVVALGVVALGAAAASATQQSPEFRAAVARVLVDVIVTDGDGEFVADLTADDFVLYEDGEPQPILGIELIDVRSSSVTADAAEGPEPEAPDTPRETATAQPGAVVFLIDTTALPRRTKERFLRDWDEALAATTELEIPHAVYMLDVAGRLVELAPLTDRIEDLQILPGLLRGSGMTGAAFSPTLGLSPAMEAAAADPIAAGGGGDSASADAMAAGNPFITATNDPDERRRRFTERGRALFTYRALADFARTLSARRGRTALVWVSTGVSLGGFTPEPDVVARQERFHRIANSANVSVYSVDPSLLADIVGGGPGIEVQEAANPNGRPSPATRAGGNRDERSNSLRHAARETGGRSFIGWAEIERVMTEIREDSSRYYLISYAPPPPVGDGEYHSIRVQVNRPRVRVRARRGYVDEPGDLQRARFASAALAMPGMVDELPFRVQVSRAFRPASTPVISLAAAVDGDALQVAVGADGRRTASVEVHATVHDGRRVVAELHDVVGATWNARDDDDTIDVLMRLQDWEVAPGLYDVRVALIDDLSGRAGAQRLVVEVPEPGAAGMRFGDPVLVERAPRGLRPVVGGVVHRGVQTRVHAEIYGGDDPVVRWRLGSPDGELPAGYRWQWATETDGYHTVTFVLPELAAGAYRLELLAEDERDSRTAEMLFEVRDP